MVPHLPEDLLRYLTSLMFGDATEAPACLRTARSAIRWLVPVINALSFMLPVSFMEGLLPE
jgi:hypothetical protein